MVSGSLSVGLGIMNLSIVMAGVTRGQGRCENNFEEKPPQRCDSDRLICRRMERRQSIERQVCWNYIVDLDFDGS